MSDSELTTAYQAIPGYQALAHTATVLRERLAEQRRTKVPPGIAGRTALAHKLVDYLNDGGQLPDDLGTHQWGPEWRDSMRQTEHQNLLVILGEASNRADNALRVHLEQHTAPALAHLNTRLQDILNAGRNGQDIEQTTRQYAAVRQAQQTITIDALNPGPREIRGNITPSLDLLRSGGEMADRFEQWPRWSKGGKPGNYQPDERPPWPTGPDTNRIDYTTAYVQWAVHSSAHLWVPTIPQLKAAARREHQLAEARQMHAEAIRNGYQQRERFEIPEHLSLGAFLAEHGSKEPAHV